MRLLTCIVLSLTLPVSEGAFALPEEPVAFEVASVKPTPPTVREVGGFYTYPGGRIVATGCNLHYLVMEAFDLLEWQVTGGPGWLAGERWEIEAKPPASSSASKSNPALRKLPPNAEQRKMLQTLLAERFKLKWHLETREGPVYLLVRGNQKLKLQEPKDAKEYPWAGSVAGGYFGTDGISGMNITMPSLAKRLSSPVGRLVLDRTGLEGSYDFKYEYHALDGQADGISVLMTSLEAIGLKLQSAKGPVETLVIDSAERPDAN